MLQKTIDNVRKSSKEGVLNSWEGITEVKEPYIRSLVERELKVAWLTNTPAEQIVDHLKLFEATHRATIKALRIAHRSKRALSKKDINEHTKTIMDKLQMLLKDYYLRVGETLKKSQIADKSHIPSIVMNATNDLEEALGRVLIGELDHVYRKSYHSIGEKFDTRNIG